MKKYDANDIDEFGFHVDVKFKRKPRSRLLAVSFYIYLIMKKVKQSFHIKTQLLIVEKVVLYSFHLCSDDLHRGTKPQKEPKYF